MPKLTYVYSLEVEGNVPFPIDMLRHDFAFPRHGGDVEIIEDSLKDGGGNKKRTVRLTSLREPHAVRWMSFGWPLLHVTREILK